MGRLVGESFKEFVDKQLQIRQQTAGSGFDTLRTPQQLQIQNNRNAWLKLASSVRVQTKNEMLVELQKTQPTLTLKDIEDSERTTGESRLKDIGFSKPADFLGNKLATKAVLFNTISTVIPSNKTQEGEGDSGGYSQRSGISTTGQVWNEASSYGLGGKDVGFVPPPGLISAKVDCLNRGSIRKATVELKCYNTFQFELIELLYIRLGYTMILEWGWDKFLNNNNEIQPMGNTLTEDIWFQDYKTYNFRKLTKDVERYRELYSGNYDGFIGKVSNFNWSFEKDGSYSITLTLMSVGDVIESLKVNLPQQVKTEEDIAAIVNGYSTGLQNFPTSMASNVVNNAGSSPLAYDLFTDIMDPKGKRKWWGYGEYLNMYWLLKKDDTDKGLLDAIRGLNDGEGVDVDKFGYYLTFGELLRKINQFCIPNMSGTGMLSIDTDVATNIMAIYPNQISFDPKVALVKPSFTSNISINNSEEMSSTPTGVKTYWSFMKAMNDWVVVEGQDNSITYGQIMNVYLNYDFVSGCLQKDTNDKGDLFLFKFLQNICNGINSALGDIPNLEPILFNDSVITIQDQNKIRGIEQSKFKYLFATKPNFELFGYGLPKEGDTTGKTQSNIVQDFSFKTKIDSSLSSMISIGATANGSSTKNYDATAFSNWNSGLRDQYQFDLKDPKTEDKSKNIEVKPSDNKYKPLTLAQVNEMKAHFMSSTTDTHCGPFRRSNVDSTKFDITFTVHKDVESCPITGNNYSNTEWKEYVDDVIEDLNDRDIVPEVKDLEKFSSNYIRYLIQCFRGKANGILDTNGYYFHLNPEFIKQGKQSFKAYVNIIDNGLYAATGTPSTKIGFIPASLGLTCDGISGIGIYNSLKVRQGFLPAQYPKALDFVISKVNHQIGDNTWSTALETISTPKTKEESLDAFTGGVVDNIVSQQSENFVLLEGDAPRVSLTTSIPLDNTNLSNKWKEDCQNLIYVPQKTEKTQIVLHHTAGVTNAAGDIRGWSEKTFPLATHYHIDRNGFNEHVFPLEYWSKHIAATPGTDRLNKISIGIEIVSLGKLTKTDKGWIAWTGKVIPENEIADPYTVDDNNNIVKMEKGYRYVNKFNVQERFQKYTPEQISTVKSLIIDLKTKFNIPVYLNKTNYKELFPKANSKSKMAMDGQPGIYTHCSYRTDKSDILPQKEILEMLMEIGSL